MRGRTNFAPLLATLALTATLVASCGEKGDGGEETATAEPQAAQLEPVKDYLTEHPVDVDLPLWMGAWLGVYPNLETLVAQLLAFCFVVGSYFAAEWVRKRELRSGIASAEETRRAAGRARSAIRSRVDAVATSPHRPPRP